MAVGAWPTDLSPEKLADWLMPFLDDTLPTHLGIRLTEVSAGKDTTTGHWELTGVQLDQPFPLYPHGFPAELMAEFEARIGRGWLGNYPASGTEIIKELGKGGYG